jgi:branched-chain amino acid transport system substrate-binding protein
LAQQAAATGGSNNEGGDMTEKKEKKGVNERKIGGDDITRRRFIKLAGSAGVATIGASMFPRISRAAQRDYILVGHPMASTGPLAPFGETGAFAGEFGAAEINKAGGIFIKELGKKLPIRMKPVDSESDPTKAGDVASKLILQDKVDMMFVMSTPATANPVSAMCERYQVPCVTGLPYEGWMTGGPYKWTFNYFFNINQMVDLFIGMWDEWADKTNKAVGGIWPNDPDGITLAEMFPKKLQARGYKLVDVGRHPFGMQDFTAFINTWKKEKVEIITGAPIPPDFAVLWKQCKQNAFYPNIATIAKALLFPSAAEALGGNLAQGITSEIWWSPMHPFKSSLSGISSKQLADAWTAKTKRQWTQPLGGDYAGMEIIADVLKRAGSLDKNKIQEAIRNTNLKTIFGHIKFNEKNYAQTPLVGGQWVKGKKWPWELEITFNKTSPEIPTTAKMIFPMPK